VLAAKAVLAAVVLPAAITWLVPALNTLTMVLPLLSLVKKDIIFP
jgi:uncharacterized membrane protein